jgi:hypothetical protein
MIVLLLSPQPDRGQARRRETMAQLSERKPIAIKAFRELNCAMDGPTAATTAHAPRQV